MPCFSTRCPGRLPYVLFPLMAGLHLMGSRSCCANSPSGLRDTTHLMPVEQGLPWHPVATGLAGQAVPFIVAASHAHTLPSAPFWFPVPAVLVASPALLCPSSLSAMLALVPPGVAPAFCVSVLLLLLSVGAPPTQAQACAAQGAQGHTGVGFKGRIRGTHKAHSTPNPLTVTRASAVPRPTAPPLCASCAPGPLPQRCFAFCGPWPGPRGPRTRAERWGVCGGGVKAMAHGALGMGAGNRVSTDMANTKLGLCTITTPHPARHCTAPHPTPAQAILHRPAMPSAPQDTMPHCAARHDTTRHDTTRHDTTRHDTTPHHKGSGSETPQPTAHSSGEVGEGAANVHCPQHGSGIQKETSLLTVHSHVAVYRGRRHNLRPISRHVQGPAA